MNKKWELFDVDNITVEKLKKEFGLPDLLATCLSNRGITNHEDIQIFLKPTRNDFHDPFQMPDMR